MKLRRNEYCPIHRSLFCCGREQARKERRFQLGVQRIEDPHHPRGYRELRSPAEMRKLLNRKIAEQDGKCAICRSSLHGLQRDCARPYRAQRDGRGLARRPPREHPSSSSAVQSPKGVEKIRFRSGRLIGTEHAVSAPLNYTSIIRQVPAVPTLSNPPRSSSSRNSRNPGAIAEAAMREAPRS